MNGTTCTLANAIRAANIDTTFGGCPAGSGADTLVLTAGSTHTLTTFTDAPIFGATGLPVITSTSTIQGKGSTVQRSSATPFRLLTVAPGGALTVYQLTVQNGLATGVGYRGGAVYNQGTLTLSHSTVTGNAVTYASGGVTNQSTLAGNATSGNGGGVYNRAGGVSTLTLHQSLLTGNTAVGGPQISVQGGTVTVNDRNLFGSNNDAGLAGVAAGATDVVPGSGVSVSAILATTLAFNGLLTACEKMDLRSSHKESPRRAACLEGEGQSVCPAPASPWRKAP